MTECNTEELIEPDKRFIWHPFTDMREWCSPEHESLVLVEGRGALLRDSRGREYIDRNSSIWTNIHGHNHPHMMTGSGRTGRMFASEHKGVIPDIQVLGKELTEGYFPLAITLISEKLFSAFDGSVADGKALAYGHSYTGNALGCAAAKASLEVFEDDRVLEAGAENPVPQLRTCRFKGDSWRKRSAPMRIYCRNRNLAR